MRRLLNHFALNHRCEHSCVDSTETLVGAHPVVLTRSNTFLFRAEPLLILDQTSFAFGAADGAAEDPKGKGQENYQKAEQRD